MPFIQNKRLNFVIALSLGLVILFFILNRLKWFFIYFGIALILVYFFDPFYKFLLAKKIPKVLATLLIIGIIIALLALIIFLLIPSVINQINILYQEVPVLLQKFQELILSLEPHLAKFMNPANVENLLKENLAELQKYLLGFFRNIVIYLSSIIPSVTFGLVIVPLILFYLLKDMDIFKENLYVLVSPERRKDFKEILEEIDHIVSGFIRGRIIVCFIVGSLIGIGLYLLNLKYALIIGLVSGILNFIPYLGPIVGAVLALIFAWGSPWWVWITIIGLFVLINQLEAAVLDPNILGKELGLHPLTVILFILICGQLLGILGVLIAVPLAAILKVLTYRYLGQEGAE